LKIDEISKVCAVFKSFFCFFLFHQYFGCVSGFEPGNKYCIVPILTDDPKVESCLRQNVLSANMGRRQTTTKKSPSLVFLHKQIITEIRFGSELETVLTFLFFATV
jgi:hypothetical protein